MSGKNSERASIELKDTEVAATVSEDLVVKFVIGLWVSIVAYILYTREWIPRRERRWSLQDKWIVKEGATWNGEGRSIWCLMM